MKIDSSSKKIDNPPRQTVSAAAIAGGKESEEQKNGDKHGQKKVATPPPRNYSRFVAFKLGFSVDDHYVFTKELGKGTYGAVAECTDKRNGKRVAIKRMEFSVVTVKGTCDDSRDRTVFREVLFLSRLKHPNILTLLDVVVPRFDMFEEIYLVTSAFDCTLEHIMAKERKQKNGYFAQPGVKERILFQLLCGIQYMHTRNLVHRDLKPCNIFMGHDGKLVIGDLGGARCLTREIAESGKDDSLSEYVVTRTYRAPEVLCRVGSSNARYDTKVDLWSIGCILTQMVLGGEMPWYGKDNTDMIVEVFKTLGTPTSKVLDKISDGPMRDFARTLKFPAPEWKPLGTTQDAATTDLVRSLLQTDPDLRITAEDALKHRFFDGVRNLPEFSEAYKTAMAEPSNRYSSSEENSWPRPSDGYSYSMFWREQFWRRILLVHPELIGEYESWFARNVLYVDATERQPCIERLVGRKRASGDDTPSMDDALRVVRNEQRELENWKQSLAPRLQTLMTIPAPELKRIMSVAEPRGNGRDTPVPTDEHQKQHSDLSLFARWEASTYGVHTTPQRVAENALKLTAAELALRGIPTIALKTASSYRSSTASAAAAAVAVPVAPIGAAATYAGVMTSATKRRHAFYGPSLAPSKSLPQKTQSAPNIHNAAAATAESKRPRLRL